MAGAFENQKTGVRILFGVIIGILALSMLLYLVPQGSNTAESATDVVARVGDQSVTLSDIQQQLTQIRQQSQVPPQLEGLYARQILSQLVFQKEIEYEAKRLGITVSDKERADRIKLVFWDGTGVVLVAKRLEEGQFRWPKVQDGVMRLTAAELSALLEGLDGKRVHAPRQVTVPAVPS